jgi:acetate kinase
MLVLVINCGSSSVKLAFFCGEETEPLATAMVDRVGTPEIAASYRLAGGPRVEVVCPARIDHMAALDAVITAMRGDPAFGNPDIEAIGHRVVHGGQEFSRPVRVDERVLADIRELAPLAPGHAVPNALGIEAALRLFPGVPQVAVFDTAFHQTMVPHVFRYGIPNELYDRYGIRRYGFHGTSHAYVSAEAAQLLGLDRETSRVLTAHLGNGCSATAVLGGRSVDTSMGLTPLEGLVMGTRSGNVDPNLHNFLARQTGMNLEEITDLLNTRSGLLGLSGISNDLREVTAACHRGNPAARLAIEVFCFRLARELGGLTVALGGPPQALVFTGGIGENSALVREMTLAHLAGFGFEIDFSRNADVPKTGVITLANSPGPVALVVPTREEFAIARAVRKRVIS